VLPSGSQWVVPERITVHTTRTTLRLIGVIAALVLVSAIVWTVFSPRRVLLIGDSITAQYAPVAANELRHQGYHPVVRAYPGVGLLDRGSRIDIWQHIRADLHSARANVVVAEWSGNYGLADAPLAGAPLGSDAFYSAWAQAARSFTHDATAGGAKLIWIVAPRPVEGDPTESDRLAVTYQQQQRPGKVSILDTRPAFITFEHAVYAPDGHHLSLPGAALMSQLVAHRIESTPAWRLGLRKVPHSPIILSALIVVAVCVVTEVSLRPSRRATEDRRVGAA
jgi:lysophospholipase L1-like esterase